MRVLRVFRLMLALFALGAAMAGPAAATQAMAARAMPCHEASLAGLSGAVFAVPIAAHSRANAAIADAGTRPDAARPHLCCVLSQLVVMPLAAPVVRSPEPLVAALAIPSGRMPAGVAPSTPVPPPRRS